MGPVSADYKLLIRAEMAGSRVARERHKQIVFGEALLAMTTFAGIDPENIPNHRTDELLEQAYNMMVKVRFRFSPEEFALYFLSRLLDRVERASRPLLQHGAARYLVEKRRRLSGDIAALSVEAHRLLDAAPAEPEMVPIKTVRAPETNGTAVRSFFPGDNLFLSSALCMTAMGMNERKSSA